MNKRVHMIIHGRVQGVFFRLNTRKKATALGITGWVRNNDAGTVEIVGEGPVKAVEELVAWCHTGPVFAKVAKVDITWETPKKKFTVFEVKY